MAQSLSQNPQVAHAEKLVADILDANSKYDSLISLVHQAGPDRVHNGAAIRVDQALDKAVAVAEGEPLSANTSVVYSLADLLPHKFGNLVNYSREWEEDSMEAARKNLALDIVRSHQKASDEVVQAALLASVSIAATPVADAASLTINDVYASAAVLKFHGMLPNVYCNFGVYNQLKTLESAAGHLGDPLSVLGMNWVPVDFSAATASGDILLCIGDISKEFVAGRKPLRVHVDGESSAANLINDRLSVFSYDRFSLGEYGSGDCLSKVVLA